MEAILWNLICSDIERFRYEKKICSESKQIKLKKNVLNLLGQLIFKKLSCFSSKIIANFKDLLKNRERILILLKKNKQILKN